MYNFLELKFDSYGASYIHFCDCCLHVTAKGAPRSSKCQLPEESGKLSPGEEGGNGEFSGTWGIQEEKRHF